MKKNILITGASGFIGSFIVEEAIKRNYTTFAGIRKSSSKEYLTDVNIHFIELNFSNENALANSLQEFTRQHGRFDFIIHSAGLTKAKNKEDYFSVNFDNTKRFIHALQNNNLVPDKFVYISSLASFGPGESDLPITHLQTQKPLTAYGDSKRKAEEFLMETENFPLIIINPTAVYGPREKDFYLLLKSIEKHFEIYIGSKSQLLSFVHVYDLVNAIFLAMESSIVNERILVSDLEVYNPKIVNDFIKKIMNKKTISFTIPKYPTRILATITETIGKLSGSIPILNRERLKEFEAMNWSVDCTELKKIGYKPQYNLENGLQQTIQWYQENGLLKKKE